MTASHITLLKTYAARHPAEAETMAHALDLLSQGNGDITSRANTPAHLTASVLITQGTAALMLIWHPYLEMWVQPGGHVDLGEDLSTAALREALEETGLQCTLNDEAPFDIDCLFVPANPRKGEPDHWHIDVRYLMTPIPGTAPLEPELLTLCVPYAGLGELTPSLARLSGKLMNIAHPLATA